MNNLDLHYKNIGYFKTFLAYLLKAATTFIAYESQQTLSPFCFEETKSYISGSKITYA